MTVSSYGATRKRSSHTSKHSVSTKRPVAGKSSSKGRAAASNSRYKRPTRSYARRYYQSTPSPERYKEIQQALADKGYYKGEANGQWGQDSVDALRRFQADQNLDVDGKIGSLSLIALGLGPKRVTAQAKPQQPLVQPNQPEQKQQP